MLGESYIALWAFYFVLFNDQGPLVLSLWLLYFSFFVSFKI